MAPKKRPPPAPVKSTPTKRTSGQTPGSSSRRPGSAIVVATGAPGNAATPMPKCTCSQFKSLVTDGSIPRYKYSEAKQEIVKRFKERQETIKALENEHVLREYDVDVLAFIELCDRYMVAKRALHDNEDEDEDEKEAEYEDVEFWLGECTVPRPVWNALWV